MLLHEAVQFEPVGPATVARPGLGHADQEAFAESAGLAGCPVLFIDDALTAVLALGDDGQIVVGPAKEGLQLRETTH